MTEIYVIGPEEMLAHWKQALPDAVVGTFNEELTRQFNGKSASIREENLLMILEQKGLERHKVNKQHWLRQTIELYKEQGWKVTMHDNGGDYNTNIYYQFYLP